MAARDAAPVDRVLDRLLRGVDGLLLGDLRRCSLSGFARQLLRHAYDRRPWPSTTSSSGDGQDRAPSRVSPLMSHPWRNHGRAESEVDSLVGAGVWFRAILAVVASARSTTRSALSRMVVELSSSLLHLGQGCPFRA